MIFWERTNAGGGKPICTTVYCFNPEAGETDTISTFTHTESMDLGGYYYAPLTSYGFLSTYTYNSGRYHFSEDFSKMAMKKVLSSNEEVHAGWIDASGNFFDVTEALGLQSKSDFDTPAKIYAAGFSDGYFSYYDASSDTYHYVPVDNVTPVAVQEGDLASLSGIPTNSKFAPRDITSWIDETHCIINCSYTRNGVGQWMDSVIFDTENQTTTKYVPGDSRLSWNGVVSPDGTKIAFTSAPFAYGAHNSNDIYVIPVGGGDPVKIDNHSFNLGYCLSGPCQLIDWR